jgi:hypothetical protein
MCTRSWLMRSSLTPYGVFVIGLLLPACGGKVAGGSAEAAGSAGAWATRASGGSPAAEQSAGPWATDASGGSVAALGGTGGSLPEQDAPGSVAAFGTAGWLPGQQPPDWAGNWVVDSDGPCAIPPGCGGDPIGLWECTAVCETGGIADDYAASCPGTIAAVWYRMWFLFSPRGDFSMGQESVLDVWSPTSCAPDGATGDECSRLLMPFGAECVSHADGSCSCRARLPYDVTEGTYTVQEMELVRYWQDGAEMDRFTFCASGSTMTLMTTSYATSDGDFLAAELRRVP